MFHSGFEGGVSLAAPANGWQDVVGQDAATGAAWPANLWGGKTSIQLLADGGILRNSIDSVTGHDGSQTKALHLNMVQVGGPGRVTQNPLMLLPKQEPGDLYISEWIKLPADLGQKLGPGGWITAVPEWKSAGDFRVITAIVADGNGTPYWSMKWDTNANGNVPLREFWRGTNRRVPVPQGEWFHAEFFTHRGKADGRVWLKVNGRVVFDHIGNNIGQNNAPIDRIMLASPYSNKPLDLYVDDIEIWDGVPTSACEQAPRAGEPQSGRRILTGATGTGVSPTGAGPKRPEP